MMFQQRWLQVHLSFILMSVQSNPATG